MSDCKLFKKYTVLDFKGRVFYIPQGPVAVDIRTCDNQRLSMWPAIMPELKIILGNEDDYVIANGLKCFHHVYYNGQSDMLETVLKDVMLDGLPFQCPFDYTFHFDDIEFPLNDKDPRIVVPKRHYSEVVNTFLAENPDLHEAIRHFLEKYPERFNASTPDRYDKKNMDACDWQTINTGIINTLKESGELKTRLIEEYMHEDPWLHELYAEAFGVK